MALVLCFTFLNYGEKTSQPTRPSFQERLDDFWGDYPELGEENVVYTVLPVDLEYVGEIFPLGHLSPPGHPIPTPHTYWELAREDLGAPVSGFSKPVKAPADGVITRIVFTYWSGFPDYTVYIRHTNNFTTRFNHLSEISQQILDKIGSPLKEGWDGNRVYVPVKAGDVIGKTSRGYGQSAALDMGAYARNVFHYINPEKYPVPEQQAVSPLRYFEPSLREAVLQKIKRTAEPRDGEFDFDVRGTLAGNWFLEGKDGYSEEGGAAYYLSFAYDAYDPRYLRVSLGLTLGGYLARVKGNAPDFKSVGVNSGRIVYKLISVGEGSEFSGGPMPDTVVSTLLVEMINEEKIKVELFEGEVDNPSFTANAKFFTR